MTGLIIFAIVVCLIALIITLRLTTKVDKTYDGDRNFTILSLIYVLLIPVILLILLIFSFFI